MDFFTRILSDVLKLVFEEILMPVLTEFLKMAWNLIMDLIKDAFGWIFYMAFTLVLQVVKFENDAFEFFAGTKNGIVYFENKPTTIIELIFKLNSVQKMFTAFTAVGITIAIVASIVHTVRSISDMTLDDRNPVSNVLKTAFKTAVMFAMIPILCIVLLKGSQTLLDVFDEAVVQASGKPSMSVDRMIWLSSSMEACIDTTWNASTAPAGNKSLIGTLSDPCRSKFIDGTYDYSYMTIIANGSLESEFKKTFKYGSFNNVQGIIVGIIVMFIMAGVLFGFIKRLFELVVLFITGPLFAATIPLDEGEKFKRWKDQFIGTFFAGFGPIMTMRIFVIVAPLLSDGSIIFLEGNPDGNMIIQLLLLIGGAYAVYKGQGMFMELLNPQTAGMDSENAGVGMAGLSIGANIVASSAKSFAGGIAKGFSGGGGKGADGKGDGKGEGKGEDKKDSGNEAKIPPKKGE